MRRLVLGGCFVLLLPLLLGSLPARGPGDAPPQIAAPPLFARAGEVRAVTGFVSGRPTRVWIDAVHRLYAMKLGSDDAWHGALPAARTSFDYRIVAAYGRHIVAGELRRLIVLTALTSLHAVRTDARGRVILRKAYGEDVGRAGGRQSATVGPSSFAVDERRGVIAVLDNARSRIVLFDPSGRPVRTRPLPTPTASDIVFLPDDSVAVLDDGTGLVWRIDGRTKLLGAVRQPVTGSRLAVDGGRLYMRDPAQGSYIGVGTNTPAHLPVAEVGPHSVTLETAERAVRVLFDEQVLDAAEAVVDDTGTLWALIGLYDDRTDRAETVLVNVDSRGAKMRQVGGIFGDVTRRLVAMHHGAVVMDGDRSGITLTTFGTPS